MKNYKSIAVVGRGAVGNSIIDELYSLVHTGQVLYQKLYTYDSKTIVNAYQTQPDLLIYAGVPGVKWKANQHPLEDVKLVEQAFNNIKMINAKETILISTIDAGFEIKNDNYYGLHRKYLEDRVLSEISNSRVVRLPALKGKHVVKNSWFDTKYPRLINVSESMASSLTKSINVLGLDYRLVKVSDSEYSVVDDQTQLEISSKEFGKAYANNPYSNYLWLDVDNFTYELLNTTEPITTLCSYRMDNSTKVPAFYEVHEMYRLTTGVEMMKSIRSEYKNVLPLVNYQNAEIVNLQMCGRLDFNGVI